MVRARDPWNERLRRAVAPFPHTPTMLTYLFLHGTPGCARDWDPLLAHAPAAARCVAIDLPDHGEAPDDVSVDYTSTFEAVAEAIAACPGPVVLVGHSFGAWLAAFLAPRHEARIDRLVLVEGLPGLPLELGIEFAGLGRAVAAGALPIAHAVSISAARWLPSPPPDELVARVEAMLSAQTPARLGRVLERIRLLAAPEHEVRRISAEADLVHVRGDRAVPLGTGEALFARAERGRLHLLEGDGHFPQWTQPERLASIVFGA